MEVDLNARNKCHILKKSNRGRREKSGVIHRWKWREGFFLRDIWNFPGGPELKNPPVNSGERVQFLVQEDPTCLRTTKDMHHDY